MTASATAPRVARAALSRPGARLAAGFLTTLVLVALLARIVAPYDPVAQPDIVALKGLPPSLLHPFGTDAYSRDVLSRVIYGTRVSLAVAAAATAIALVLGTLYGAAAGMASPFVDAMLMRLVDAGIAMPRLVLLLAAVAAWPRLGITALVIIIGLTGWFGLARLVRAEVRVIRQLDYVHSARALGAGWRRVLARHILPNVAPTIIVAGTLGLGHVIALEAGLSYLGLGVQPPAASWGNIIQDGTDQLVTLWWVSFFPGLFLVATVLACNSLGEALRAALDPRDV